MCGTLKNFDNMIALEDNPSKILCCYTNNTNQVQIARIANIADWYFEKVIFPGERLLFEAIPSAELEIHSSHMASSILSDRIKCDRLRLTTNRE